MAYNYLEKFRSSLPTVQGNQILKLLVSKKDSGEIRTVDEFKAQLKKLTAKILAERITPTLSLFKGIAGQDISSEQYNEMLARIEDDLSAAFSEANTLDEIISAHHNLVFGVALKALRFGINELESRVSLYEFINRSGQGFDNAVFNTFRSGERSSTARSDRVANIVYSDPKELKLSTSSDNAQIDALGERLLLSIDTVKNLRITQVEWLSNANSIRGELDVQFPTSLITNIIDGKNNTYWVAPVLLSSVRSSGVPFEVIFTLPTTQDVNFIEIEPIANFAMVLVGIDYIDTTNTRQTATSGETKLDGPVRINFGRIITSQIIVRVRQDNYSEIQFRVKPGESNFHKAILNQYTSVNLDSVSEDLRNLLSSSFILSDIFSVPSSTEQKKYFQYLAGFDNVRVGFSNFGDKGIFVSKKIAIEQPGQIALRATEVRPVQESGSSGITLASFNYPVRSTDEDNKFYHGSIEYWITCLSYNEEGVLIGSDVFPVLPLGASRVYHERLIFTKKSASSLSRNNLASLSFYTEASATDVLVYRNGTLLNYGTTASADWEFVGPLENIDDSDITVEEANTGTRMKRGIRVWATVNPLDVYTVSYTPTLSNTQVIPSAGSLLNVVDLTGDNFCRIAQDNLIVCSPTKKAYTVARAEIYLTVLLRRNSAGIYLSPSLEDYMVVTGSRDQTKFLGEP